jgi:thioesterase-3
VNGTRIKIRGYHCDSYGHVNNARYLELLEEARWEFLEPALEEKFFESRNLLFIVVNINISYKKSLLPDQDVIINITNVVYNNKSMIVTQLIKDVKTEAICSSADVTFVLLNSKTGKPETISEEIINKFNELEALRL